MKRTFTIALILGIICLSYGVFSSTCSKDTDCANNYYCNEKNQTVLGIPQCSQVNTTACDGSLTISCTTHADCAGLGSWCDTTRGVCSLIENVDSGYPCQLDSDCDLDYLCIADICSYPRATTGYKKCTSNSDCLPNREYCSSYNICVSRSGLGGYCNTDSNCWATDITGIELSCNTNHVCVGCDSMEDDNATHYCDLNRNDTCPFGTSESFYPTYAYTHELDVPIMTPKVADGDACDRTGCCANPDSDCINGKCMFSLFSNASANTSQSRLCTDLTNYTLTDHYFDGQTATAHATDMEILVWNLNNINILLNGTNGTQIRPVMGNSTDAEYLYTFRRRTSASSPITIVAFGFFYANATGDMYYVHQRDQTLLVAKFTDCLSAGLANNGSTGVGALTGAVRLTGWPIFSCISDDNTVAIQGWRNPTNNHYNMMAYSIFSSVYVIVLGGINPYDRAGFYYYIPAGDVKREITTANGDHTYLAGSFSGVIVYPFAGCGSLTSNCYLGSSGIYKIISYGQNVLGSISGADYITDYFGEAQFDEADCCSADKDCDATYCCNLFSSLCEPCPSLPSIWLFLTADPQTIAEGEHSIVTATLTDSAGTPYPSETILWNGTSDTCTWSQDTDCTTDFNGECSIDVEATACSGTGQIRIFATASSNEKHSALSSAINITVNNNSAVLKVLITDAETTLPIIWGSYGTCSALTPSTRYASLGLVGWSGLPQTPTSYVCTFGATGYESSSWEVFITNEVNVVMLDKLTASQNGTASPSLPNIALDEPLPTEGSEVTSGLLSILMGMMGLYFPWMFLIILFLVGIGVIMLLLHKATDIM